MADMTLKMQIIAQGQQALATIKSMGAAVSVFGTVCSTVGKGAKTAFGIIQRATELAFAPLKGILGVLAALGGALGAVGLKALGAAKGDQELTDRLEVLYGSAEKARKVFAQLEGMALGSQFKVDDMTEAVIVLDKYGLSSRKNLEGLAGVARVSRMSLQDVANTVSMLQARGLKRLGIGLDEKDGKYLITYRNQLGEVQKVAAKTADDARQQLIGIFSGRYGAGFAPKGLDGQIARFKIGLDRAFADIGTKLLPGAEAFMNLISTKLEELIKSGKFEQLGQKLADMLIEAWNYGAAFFKWAREVWEGLARSGPQAWADALREVISGVVKILGVSLVNYFAALGNVFKGLAKILVDTFAQDLAKIPMFSIPMRGLAQDRQRALSDKETGQLHEMLIQQFGQERMDRYGAGKGSASEQREITSFILSKTGGLLLAEGVRDATTRVAELAKETGTAASQIGRDTMTRLEKLSGARDFKDVLAETRLETQAALKPREVLTDPTANLEVVRAFRPTYTSTMHGMEESGMEYSQGRMAPKGTYKEGQRLPGGWTVFIETLNVKAGDAQKVQDELIVAAGRPAMSAAGE